MVIKEKLLFAVHLEGGYCFPLACSHSSWQNNGCPESEIGFSALWVFTGRDVEEFFVDYLNLYEGVGSSEKPNGLYVYEVEYDDTDISDNDESWEWLQGGTLRRPTIEELKPLTRGEAPWKGVVF